MESNKSNKIKPLSNIIIIKILNYAIKDSIERDQHYTFISSLSLICKSWTIFILPKLDETIFKNDDYIYTYIKVRDSIRTLNNSREETNFKICDDIPEMNAALSLLYSPTVLTGTYEVSESIYSQFIDFNIYIDGQVCGTIFKPNISLLDSLSEPSSFGKADKTVYDESIRKGLHIDGSRISVPFFDYNDPINLKNHQKYFEIDQYLKGSETFELKLYKIHIYKEGGHFEEHIDTIQDHKHIGTYIVPLGVSTYEGGEFVISENDTFDLTTIEYKIEATEIREFNYNFKWIAFYNDCLHKVKTVTKGTRIVLQFNIFYKDIIRDEDYMITTWPSICIKNDSQPIEKKRYCYIESTKYSINNQYLTLNLPGDKIETSNQINLYRISQALKNVMKERNVNTGLFLSHLYKAHINENNLKGVDIVIWNHLKEYFGAKRVKICTFIITSQYGEKTIEENIIKIAIVTPKTMNQQSSLLKYEDKVTLMFCGKKYSNLYSIYSKPLPSTGNSERYTQDVGCFSAILISDNNFNQKNQYNSNTQRNHM